MSMTTSTIPSRAGAMTLVAEGFSNRFTAIRSHLAARAERRRVFAELSGMSDRDLADIGVDRADVPRIAGFGEYQAMALLGRR